MLPCLPGTNFLQGSCSSASFQQDVHKICMPIFRGVFSASTTHKGAIASGCNMTMCSGSMGLQLCPCARCGCMLCKSPHILHRIRKNLHMICLTTARAHPPRELPLLTRLKHPLVERHPQHAETKNVLTALCAGDLTEYGDIVLSSRLSVGGFMPLFLRPSVLTELPLFVVCTAISSCQHT
jgi:hypothetical protein